MDHHDTIHLKFLEQLLIQLHIDYSSSEDAFNQLFVWPYLDIIAKMISVDGCNSDFVQGQPYLESMSRQLKAVNLYVNDRSQHKSDGLIKLFGLNKLDLLLFEASGCFSSKDEEKIKLDHHKGVYGSLVMLKCIASDYAYAFLNIFILVKIFFLQAADAELHLWSVCFQKQTVFDLWREANIKVKPDFQCICKKKN
ncbi:hypothetical protein RMATCC62417_13553 [Rhizopus microsporus]|nr:hypothetical protein RMATCC62417_13553 [Rhizopus microsporus]